jgi:hypothetical protein
MACARRLIAVAGLLFGCGSGGSQNPMSSDASQSDVSAMDGAAPEAGSPESGNPPAPDGGSDTLSSQDSSGPDVGPASDGSSMGFTDPNPSPCAGMDAGALCLMGWPDISHPFTGCCLTTFPQDPQGKCGVSSGASACYERKAPGNPDSSCMGGSFTLDFGGFFVGGSGVPGCCQWRTGTCGVAADDLGCIDYAQTFYRGKPCTPDYSKASIYP